LKAALMAFAKAAEMAELWAVLWADCLVAAWVAYSVVD